MSIRVQSQLLNLIFSGGSGLECLKGSKTR
uniref:Uncharacterized protein n=1 Tax=Salix viminalis TaxID=40686 RepID=A0A6N2N1F4_SALVM